MKTKDYNIASVTKAVDTLLPTGNRQPVAGKSETTPILSPVGREFIALYPLTKNMGNIIFSTSSPLFASAAGCGAASKEAAPAYFQHLRVRHCIPLQRGLK